MSKSLDRRQAQFVHNLSTIDCLKLNWEVLDSLQQLMK